ncbi:MAG TPA: HlyD family efflux transporter periplasmic adaptor subunit [Blastocatellia bacterium]|jgi:HlyD family secretion protein
MDIPRKSAAKKKKIRRIIYTAAVILAVAGITIAVSQLKPAAQSLKRDTALITTVKRGPLKREVRGPGTLVPEEVRYVPTIVQGRVEKRLLQPGERVTHGTVLIELSNPVIEQALTNAESQYRGSQANLSSLQAQLKKQILDQESTISTVDSEYKKAEMQAKVNEDLGKKGLKSELEVNQSRITADALFERVATEKKRLEATREQNKATLAAEEERVRQLRDAVEVARRDVEYLKVRAGIDGVLQTVEVEVGQQVQPGANLARVANPERLKAQLRIAETQAKDLLPGQPVTIDTRNGLIPGRVIRIDPAAQNGTVTVDASLEPDGEMPKGVRPELNVDGTILLEMLEDVLYIQKPVHGQEGAQIGLFKLEEGDQYASRTPVQLGRSSVSFIEVRGGLQEGDKVIISDTSQYDSAQRVQLN